MIEVQKIKDSGTDNVQFGQGRGILGTILGAEMLFVILDRPVADGEIPAAWRYCVWDCSSDRLNETIRRERLLYREIGVEEWHPVLSSGGAVTGGIDEFSEAARPFFISNAVRSVLVLPLFSSDRFLGSVGIGTADEERRWSAGEIDRLRRIADVVAAASLSVFQDSGPGSPSNQLRIQEALTDNLFEAAPEAIVILDTEDHILRINPEFTNIFGYAAAEVAGKTLLDLIIPEHFRDEASNLNQQVFNEHRLSFETVRRRKDGSILDVSILAKPIYIDDDQIAILAIYRDISGKKRMESLQNALYRISEAAAVASSMDDLYAAIYRAVLSLMPLRCLLIALRDPGSTTLHPSYCFSETGNEVPGELAALLEHAVRSGASQLTSSAAMKSDPAADERLADRSGTKDMMAVPLKVGDTGIGAIGIQRASGTGSFTSEQLELLTSISTQAALAIDRRRTEEALKKSQADLQDMITEKNLFLSILSHDLRSPFTATLGYAELLCYENDLTIPQVREYAEAIRSSVERQVELATKMLEWSRLESGRIPFQPRRLELSFVIEGIANMLKLTATQKNVLLSTKVEEGLIAYADEGLVFQVVMNLINNAIKFTRPGGRVQVEARTLDNATVLITVNDNGIGIPGDALGKLFRYEKLYSTRGTEGELGTGLGLSICKRIIDLHRGTITVRSEVEKGTNISFTLPTGDIFLSFSPV